MCRFIKEAGGSVVQRLRNSVRGLRDLFFPRRCIVCGRPLQLDEKEICPECFAGMPLTWFWDWPQNAAFERMAAKIEIEAAASFIRFTGLSPYRGIQYGIKYRSRQELGYRMGRLFGGYLAGSREFRNIDIVVPVPLHPLRRWSRGYNQSEAIASGIACALGKPLETKLVRRSRYTRSQTKLSGAAKSRNVSGAFAVYPRRAGELAREGVRNVLLVDDVMTTGATLTACASALTPVFRIYIASLAFVGE